MERVVFPVCAVLVCGDAGEQLDQPQWRLREGAACSLGFLKSERGPVVERLFWSLRCSLWKFSVGFGPCPVLWPGALGRKRVGVPHSLPCHLERSEWTRSRVHSRSRKTPWRPAFVVVLERYSHHAPRPTNFVQRTPFQLHAGCRPTRGPSTPHDRPSHGHAPFGMTMYRRNRSRRLRAVRSVAAAAPSAVHFPSWRRRL